MEKPTARQQQIFDQFLETPQAPQSVADFAVLGLERTTLQGYQATGASEFARARGLGLPHQQDIVCLAAWHFTNVSLDFEAELAPFDGEHDQAHLLVNDPPKIAVSTRVNSLKGVSSRMIRKKSHACIRENLWDGALWSPSYFADSCGGAPVAIIRQYIEQQQRPG